MTWSSLNIDAYLEAANLQIAAVREVVSKLRDSIECRIEAPLRCTYQAQLALVGLLTWLVVVQASPTLALAADQTITIKELADRAETQMSQVGKVHVLKMLSVVVF